MPRQITRTCEFCGKSFTLALRGFNVPKGRGRYCDRWCAAQVNRRRPEADRFWEKVNKDGPIPERCPDLGPCWLWTAGLQKGYGMFASHVIGAHVWAYTTLVGPIPKGLELDHLCYVRACVNPAHLEPVTKRENILRGESFAAKHARKTHCKNGHPFAGENLIIKDCRRCLTCLRQYQANDRQRKRERKHAARL